ncbi:hypothetical protein pEaSNUABM50_00487 [Erwinia phage pEa_SNUABM_50]|uniref:Uncharacterized protein n=1 Tax=Erwinia phage pEa_SNUABM_50 TaxID=2768775 RepID=A0A7L8ZPQ6_9CAUD|nr:hypothetical protein pEaSNUABM50_00487 [Erwinia phage pEa_SNUABM_50]
MENYLPKSELIVGRTYSGSCRNSDTAVWTGTQFTYEREKFGSTYNDSVNHPEDDDNYDLFYPTELLKETYLPKYKLVIGAWYHGYGCSSQAMWIGNMFMYNYGNTEKEAKHVDDSAENCFIPYRKIDT